MSTIRTPPLWLGTSPFALGGAVDHAGIGQNAIMRCLVLSSWIRGAECRIAILSTAVDDSNRSAAGH